MINELTDEAIMEIRRNLPMDANNVVFARTVLHESGLDDKDAEITALTAERDHWKANHDAQVQRARLLVEREDMPVERVKAYEQVVTLTTERDALRKDAAEVSSQAARDVLAERQRQIGVEGWIPELDDEYQNAELPSAAVCYAQSYSHLSRGVKPSGWPWSVEWWKPKDRRSNLVKATALLLAEIERIDRAAMTKETK